MFQDVRSLRGPDVVGGRGLDLERLGNEAGVFLAGGVMEVAHRGLDVGVAHPLLDPADVGLADHPGPERVAEIMVVPTSAQARICRCCCYADFA